MPCQEYSSSAQANIIILDLTTFHTRKEPFASNVYASYPTFYAAGNEIFALYGIYQLPSWTKVALRRDPETLLWMDMNWAAVAKAQQLATVPSSWLVC